MWTTAHCEVMFASDSLWTKEAVVTSETKCIQIDTTSNTIDIGSPTLGHVAAEAPTVSP